MHCELCHDVCLSFVRLGSVIETPHMLTSPFTLEIQGLKRFRGMVSSRFASLMLRPIKTDWVWVRVRSEVEPQIGQSVLSQSSVSLQLSPWQGKSKDLVIRRDLKLKSLSYLRTQSNGHNYRYQQVISRSFVVKLVTCCMAGILSILFMRSSFHKKDEKIEEWLYG